MNIKTVTYNISDHYLSALINNDFSGLEEDDVKILNEFIDRGLAEYPMFYTLYPNDTETNFSRCDICNLYSNCIEVEFQIGD